MTSLTGQGLSLVRSRLAGLTCGRKDKGMALAATLCYSILAVFAVRVAEASSGKGRLKGQPRSEGQPGRVQAEGLNKTSLVTKG